MLAIVAVAASAVLMPLAVLALPVLPAPARGRVRLGLIGAVYLVVFECGAMLGGLWLWLSTRSRRDAPGQLPADPRHDALCRRLSAAACRLALGLSRVRLTVEGSVTVDPGREVLVLARHAGAYNCVFVPYLVELLIGRPGRFVASRVILLIPGLALLVRRTGGCLVRPGAWNAAAQIASWGRGIGADGACVLFPEGTSFTAKRREALVSRLRTRRLERLATQAREFRNVLPPSVAGFHAALSAMPDAEVVIIAHTGLAPLGSSGPGEDVVRVRCWRVPSGSIPDCERERGAWLSGWWRRVDAWADEHSREATYSD